MLPIYLAPELTTRYNQMDLVFRVNKLVPPDWNTKYGKDANLYIHRLGNDDPLFEQIKSWYKKPNWISHVEFFQVPSNSVLPAHIDNTRKVALNIPVLGDFENTSADFYDISHIVKEHNIEGARGFGGHAKLISRVNYTCPVYLSTQIPHGTTNKSSKHRTILSVTFHEKVNIGMIIREKLAGMLYTDDK